MHGNNINGHVMQTGDGVGGLDGNDSGLCPVASFNSSDAGYAGTAQNSVSNAGLLFRDAKTQLPRQRAAEY
jgi:hypothetical protein